MPIDMADCSTDQFSPTFSTHDRRGRNPEPADLALAFLEVAPSVPF
jgi:hypothetical protein